MTATSTDSHYVSLVALPDGAVSTLFGIYDAMNAFAFMDMSNADSLTQPPFRTHIVGEAEGSLELASGVPVGVQRSVDAIEASDIVIVPSLRLGPQGWKKGRYPRLVEWLQAMHDRGAVICSACSGIFLLAETGLFDGKDATVHFAYARAFGAVYPKVAIQPERALVISGVRAELGRVHDLARPRAVPHRALRGHDGRAGSRADVRAAMASGWRHPVHHLRGED